MKAISKFLVAFVAIALLGVTASCSKDDNNSGNGSSTGGNNYSTLIVGTWSVESVVDENSGQELYSDALDMRVAFRTDGSGVMTYNSGYGPFSWVISGNTCKVYIEGFNSPYDYTIVSMNATQMVFTSKVLDMPGYNHVQGNFRWTLSKVQ